jgi:alanine racemase
LVTDPDRHATAVLTIDLDAIVANWRTLAARLKPGARCAAVVKADAYGLGAAKVAPALQRAGCRRFVVATLDEGLALRPLLPGADILVLSGPFAGTEHDILAADLLPVLNSPEQVAAWAAFAKRAGRRLPAAVHVDTGMSRLGLSHSQAAALAEDSAALGNLDLRLVMSHLACADEPRHPMNRRQLDAFNAARALFPDIEGSLAASSGIFLGLDWHADWGRPGAALYGVQPTAEGPNPMVQVVRLEGRIIQLRDVDAGETVGYGATHRVSARSRLAIVAAGYADGIFRSLSNRGCGHLGENQVPLVGRVSMDLIIFDVTGLPDGVVHPGAMIDLIGPNNTVDQMARDAGTIGYEVLTALGRRYCRRYLGGAAE